MTSNMWPFINFPDRLTRQLMHQQHQTAHNCLSTHHVVPYLQAFTGTVPSGQNSVLSSLTHPAWFSSFASRNRKPSRTDGLTDGRTTSPHPMAGLGLSFLGSFQSSQPVLAFSHAILSCPCIFTFKYVCCQLPRCQLPHYPHPVGACTHARTYAHTHMRTHTHTHIHTNALEGQDCVRFIFVYLAHHTVNSQ